MPAVPKKWDPKHIEGLINILKDTGCAPEQKAGSNTKKSMQTRRLSDPTKKCLVQFQRMHTRILEIKYGLPNGALTVWYLTQAAVALNKGCDYDVEPPRATAHE